MELTVTEAEKLKNKPDESNLGFGSLFTDHMFNMDSRRMRDGILPASNRTLPSL